MIEVSIICPVYNEFDYIDECIRSILAQDFPLENMELLLVDGLSSDGTREKIADYQKKYGFIKLLDNHHRTVPYALNLAIEIARGAYIARIDAHATFPKNYISTLYRYSKDLDADNVGALINTLPANNSVEAKAIAFTLSSTFGMGNSLFRVGVKNIQEVDTVPFGFFKKSIFDKIGFFDIELDRNQDDEFNGRIRKNGGKIYLIPELSIDYYARGTLSNTFKMFYQYGLFKPLVNTKLGSPATIRQFFPLFFVIGLYLGLLLSVLHPIFLGMYFFILFLYFSISIFFTIKAYQKYHQIKLFFYLPLSYFVVHYAYGWGYLVGVKNLFFDKRSEINISR